MKVVIIKYNAGNTCSVQFALERLGITPIISDDAETIQSADRVIFPGVGEASSAMEYLRQKGLDKIIKSLTQPVLGICLGMQLMCSHSEEGDTECLGIFDEKVKRFEQIEGYKVPQMGWNSIYNLQTQAFVGLPEDSYVYFVHSYYAEVNRNTIATTNYIKPYSSALHKDNFYGMQFHPEKSGTVGEQILQNFLFSEN